MESILYDGADFLRETEHALQRIRKYVRKTPIEYSYHLSQLGKCHVHLKLENLQTTGSFKVRGAANALLSLSQEEKARGMLVASSGNHANALAYLCQETHIESIFYLPENASRVKIAALEAYPSIEIRFHGIDVAETERFVREMARKNEKTFIPPYNDAKVIAGQATIALELRKELSESLHAVFVPVGGGGLISGIAGYLKSLDKNIEIVACQPENSAVMYESVKAGRIVDMKSKPTHSDGTAGGIEKGSLTFEYCKRYVDDFVLVTEDEIENAIRLMIERHYLLVEGAAALSVAAFLKLRNRFKHKTVALIVSGNKISPARLSRILCDTPGVDEAGV